MKSKETAGNAKLKRKAKRKMKQEMAKKERESRVARVTASMSFLLERLTPLSDGNLAWRQDGRSSLRKNGKKLVASLSLWNRVLIKCCLREQKLARVCISKVVESRWENLFIRSTGIIIAKLFV